MAFEVGSLIEGRYRVLAVHQGGMGSVYIVEDAPSRTRYAVKTVHDMLASDPRVLQRFRLESRTWIHLGRHAHIVQGLAFREAGGSPLLFLEYIDGIELKDILDLGRPVFLPQALAWAAQVAEAMAYVHTRPLGEKGRGVVHRDLKPGNVLIARDRRAKVTDFGLARVPESSLHLTATGAFLGTPYYAAPEQIRDPRSVDRRADIYSFGAVLYEMLAGRRPFEADSMGALVHRVLEDLPPDPRDANPDIPRALAELVAACLQKDPDRRPQAFRSILERLAPIARDAAGLSASEEGYTSCASCGLWVPSEVEGCLFDRSRSDRPAVEQLDPYGDTVDWGEAIGPGSTTLDGPAASSAPPRPAAPESAAVEPGASERAVEGSPAPGPAASGASTGAAPIELRSVRISAHRVRPGDEVRVRLAFTNRGPEPVRCRIPFAVPLGGRFELLEERDAWRGVVPPTPGDPFEIAYRFQATETGRFASDALCFEYEGPDGIPRTARTGERMRICVDVALQVPVVGRDGELARLQAALADARRGGGGLVVLRGEAGMGKSRLLAEVARTATEAGGRVLAGSASLGVHEPLRPFREMLLRLLGAAGRAQEEGAIREALARRLADAAGPDRDTIAFIAAFLRGGHMGSTEDDPVRAYHWFRLFEMLAAGAILVVVLDSLQWADFGTMNLMIELAARARERRTPVLVCGACRTRADEEAADAVRYLEDRLARTGEGAAVIDLRPLDLEGTKGIVDHVFPGHDFDVVQPWLAETVHRSAGGNPAFVLEIVRELVTPAEPGREPLIRGRPGAWRVDPSLDREHLLAILPSRAEGLIQRRLQEIEPGEREVLEIAGLLGEEVEVGVLEELIGDEDRLDRALDGLQCRGILEPADPTLETYRFAQPLVPVVVRAEVGRRGLRKARRLHRRIAEALERRHGGERERRLTIAHHWLEGGDRARGAARMIDGLAWLVEQALFRDARAHLRRLEALCGDAGDVPALRTAAFHILKGRILLVDGEYEGSLGAFLAAERDAAEREDRPGLGRALVKMGEVESLLGRSDASRASFQRALEILQEAGDEPGIAEAHNCLGISFKAAGDLEAARVHFDEALSLRRRAGDRRGECGTLINLSNVHMSARRYDDARACCRGAAEIARDLKDVLLEGISHLGLGNASLLLYEVRDALEHYRAALELYKRIGYKLGTGRVLLNTAEALASDADFGPALRDAALSLRIRKEIGHRWGEAKSRLALGSIHLRIGGLARAQEEAQAALAIWKDLGDARGEAEALLLLGRVDAARGDLDAARRRLGEAAARAAASGHRAIEPHVRLARAAIACREGAGAPLAAFREIEEMAERAGASPLRVEAAAKQAACHFARGEVERAQVCSARALAAAEGLPAGECEIWALLFQHYEILEALGFPEAARFLERAHAALTRAASTLEDDRMRAGFLAEELRARIVHAAGGAP